MKIKNIFIFSLLLLSIINLNADIRNNITYTKIIDSKIIEEYGNIKFIKVSPDNKYSISYHSKEIKYKPVGFIIIRETSSSKIISIINYPGDYISVSNKYIASVNQNDEVFLWDITTGNFIRKFGEFKKNDDLIFNNMAEITRDEKYIIGLLGEIFVWEIETLVNLVRAYPDKFAKSFVDYYYNVYLKGDFNKESIYYKSLYEDLKKAKSTGALYPSKKLSYATLFHAKDSWKNYLLGHVSSDGTGMFERIDRYADGDMFGENCYYGLGDPFLIVLALLIDEGVPDFGHRYNMLSKDWKSIGISIFDYNPNYGEICVQDFSDIIEK